MEKAITRPPIIKPGWLIKSEHRGEVFRGKYYKYSDSFCIVRMIGRNGHHPKKPGRIVIGNWKKSAEKALDVLKYPFYYQTRETWSAGSDERNIFQVLSKEPRGLGRYCLKCGRNVEKRELFTTISYVCEKCGEVDPFSFELENEKDLLDVVERMDKNGELPVIDPWLAEPLPLGEEDFQF